MEMIKSLLAFKGGVHTLLLGRLWSLLGLILAALAGMSWAPLITLAGAGGFTRGQIIALFIVLFVQGVAVEAFRRYKERITAGGVVKEEGDQ